MYDSTKKTSEAATTHQEAPNYAQALRMLKNADALIEKRKKQLRVQAVKAQKGSWFQYEQAHRQQLRAIAQAENEKTLSAVREMQRKQTEKIKALRQKGQQARKESILNRSKSRVEALEQKVRIKEQIRLKSEQHSEKIKQFRKDILERKKERCIQLYNVLKSSRMHVEDMNRSRVSSIRQNISRERDQLMDRLKRRRQQLEKLDIEEGHSSIQVVSKEKSTADKKSRQQLPYRRTSAYLQGRKKSISEARFDISKRAIVYCPI